MATRRLITDRQASGLLRLAAQAKPDTWQRHIHLEADPASGDIYLLRWDEELGRVPSPEQMLAAADEQDTSGRLRAQQTITERLSAIEARLDAAGL